MTARRAGQKVFDWIKIASRVPAEAKADFSAFRGRHEACRASLSAYPEKPEPIDWDFYRRNISVQGLVDSFQKQFQAVSIPYPKDTESSEIDEREKNFEVLAQKDIAESKVQMQEFQAELAKLKAQKAFEDMTIDEYMADYPELQKKVDEDTRNHIWYLPKDY